MSICQKSFSYASKVSFVGYATCWSCKLCSTRSNECIVFVIIQNTNILFHGLAVITPRSITILHSYFYAVLVYIGKLCANMLIENISKKHEFSRSLMIVMKNIDFFQAKK